MNHPARRREVTADGMTRVAAVVASLVESSSPDAEARGKLTDLIAKAAQEVEQLAGGVRVLHMRSMAQRGRASESLRAAQGGDPAVPVRKLDVVR